MKPTQKQLNVLLVKLNQAIKILNLSEENKHIKALEKQMAKADFWQNRQEAEKISKQTAELRKFVDKWFSLRNEITSAIELADLADDQQSQTEVKQLADKLQKKLEEALQDVKMSGQYDKNPAIVQITAGVGGTDAQDWAQMLQQMYLKYANTHDMSVEVLDTSYGEEAGLKSTTLRISGLFAYGKLKSEKGVHRLVRLSPFNSDNLRQTSFALVDVLPEIDDSTTILNDKDLRVDVFRSGGRGGQSVNTTDSAVRITHIPTGTVVSIQNERSQLKNKQAAKTILLAKLLQLAREQKLQDISQLRGQLKSADWGSQIRSYVLHPYTKVKDHRSGYETSDASAVLGGRLDDFIDAYLQKNMKKL